MSRFSSGVQRRRRSPRVMISTRVLCGLLRLVVRALSSSAAKSEALSFAALHHSESACRNVAAPHRLPVIPPKSGRNTAIAYDKAMYRWRHLIENFFAKLKEFRAIATRYDKTDESLRANIHLAAAIIAVR